MRTETTVTDYPTLLHTVLDTTDVRGLAEFYRRLLGLQYRSGDEPPAEGPDIADWLPPDATSGVLLRADRGGPSRLAFQQVERLERTTWPRHDVPMQLHLDLTVPTVED